MRTYGNAGRLLPGDLGYHDTQYAVDQAAELERDAARINLERFEPAPTPIRFDPVLRGLLRGRIAAKIADARASEDENETRLCFETAEEILAMVEARAQ